MKQSTDGNELILEKTASKVDLKKKLFRVIRLWPWFILSLLICLSSAWLYLRFTKPVYEAVASLMMKDEKKGADLSYNAALEELGLGINSKIVENEIEVLRSYDLMQSVVDTLKLYITVQNERPRMSDIVLFGDEIPFILEIINPEVIKKTVHWKINHSLNTVLFQSENDRHFIGLEYGKIYKQGDIFFRCMWRDTSSDFSVNKEVYRTNLYKVDISSREEAVFSYSKKLTVEPTSKVATVINLEIQDNNKEKAVAILRTLISTYTQQGKENKNLVMDNTVDFLNQRLATVARELRGMEGSVEKFKSQNSVTDLSSDADQYLSISKQIDEQKAENQTQLNIIDALETNLLENKDNPKLVPTTFGLKDPSLSNLIEKHNELVLQKNRVQEKSGPKNPLLIDLQNQITELRKRLFTNVSNLKQAYTIALNDISLKDAQMSDRIKNVPQFEKKLVQITRNKNVQEQLYSFLLQKREEAAVSRKTDIEDSRTIVSARGLDPVSPKTQLIWIIAFFIGCILPVAFIGLRDFFDNKIVDADEVKQKTSLPLLGIISHVRKFQSGLVVNTQTRSAAAEQIRNIRTAISYSGKGAGVKNILVTSFQVGDGKSFVSLNLAAAYALLNKKTVILEFDLRQPHIGKSLGINTGQGISDVLSGQATVEEILVEIQEHNGNLFLLPAGHLPPNPAELISAPGMDCLIKLLQERFDYIIIDTPPYNLVADATLLKRYADVTLIVLRQGYTSREVYAELNHRIEIDGVNGAYVLLNDVPRKTRYQRGYGYYHEK